MKNRILALALTLLTIIALCTAISATDSGDFTISLQAGGIIDNTIHFDLMMANNPGFAGISVEMDFDENVFRPVSYDKKVDIDYSVFDTVLGGTVTSNLMEPGVDMASLTKVTYYAISASNYKNASGKLMGFTLEIIDEEKFFAEGTKITLDVYAIDQSYNDVVPVISEYEMKITEPESVTISSSNLTLNVGGSSKLTATVNPTDAYDKSVTWSSSNTEVVTVDANGKVSAVGLGAAVITVKTVTGNKTATCNVTVKNSVQSVSLNAATIVMDPGEIKALTATVLPADATNKNVVWSSSNTAVATVNANGLVSAVASGNARITVKTVDGGKTAVCNVVVTVPVSGVSLSKTNIDLKVGEAAGLSAIIAPANATNKNVTWISSDTNVATVDINGKVTAVSSGSAIITVTTVDGGFTAECKVTVKNPVTSVSLNKNDVTLDIGDTEKLIADILPKNATVKDVIWTTSNEYIATVDSNGVVTALTSGEAVITVTTKDGGFTDNCIVNVNVDPNAPQIVVESVKALVGKEFKVKISIANNPGIAGIVFKLAYDSSVMTLTDIEYNSAFSGVSNFDQNPANNPVSFNFTRAADYKGVALAELTFAIKDNAPEGVYDLKLMHNGLIVNSKLDELNISMISGTVNVIKATPGDLNDDGFVNTKDAVLLAQYLANWEITVNLDAADCNADGTVNSKDAVLLAQYLARWDVTLG